LIGKNQIVGLLKIAAFCHDPELLEKRQSEIRKQCLELWKLPDDSRHAHNKKSNEQYYADLLGAKWHKEKFFNAPDIDLENPQKIQSLIHSVHDWYFVGLDVLKNTGRNIRTFFMSKGKRDVLYFDPIQNTWQSLQSISIEMSPETLLYAEIVREYINEGKSQVVMNSIHIIDAIVLGGKDIRQLPLEKRNKICQKFAKALNKPHPCIVNQNAPIRCKRLFKLADLERFFDLLIVRKLKDSTKKLGYNVGDKQNERFYVPRGLLLLDEVRSDKIRCLSSQNRIYYYDKRTKQAKYAEQLPDMEKYASFKNSYTNRLIWKWERLDQISEYADFEQKDESLLYREDILNFIKSKLSKNT
jgi:cap1 methyltransferase